MNYTLELGPVTESLRCDFYSDEVQELLEPNIHTQKELPDSMCKSKKYK